MAATEQDSVPLTSICAEAPIISHYSKRVADLLEEIDSLRKAMTETFLQEHSLVADSVMDLSRQLDIKINEYMKQVLMHRE
jgi:ribosomal protein S13